MMAKRGFATIDNLPICLGSAQRLITATRLLIDDEIEVKFHSNPEQKGTFIYLLCLKLKIAPTKKNANKIKVLVRKFKKIIDSQINEIVLDDQDENVADIEMIDVVRNNIPLDISNGLESLPIRMMNYQNRFVTFYKIV